MTDQLTLRTPFAPAEIGKLPKISCPTCSKAQGRCCDKHNKSKCSTCGNYITSAHVHLDYVGHAAVTDRLLKVDPEWTWEPLALDVDGLPAVRVVGNEACMWIKLTVSGTTRLGVGSCPAGAFERDKQLIGDALRNAAMRFGVALDLWSKEDLESEGDTQPTQPRAQAPTHAAPAAAEDEGAPPAGLPADIVALRARLGKAGKPAMDWLNAQRFPTPWSDETCHKITQYLDGEAAGPKAGDPRRDGLAQARATLQGQLGASEVA